MKNGDEVRFKRGRDVWIIVSCGTLGGLMKLKNNKRIRTSFYFKDLTK